MSNSFLEKFNKNRKKILIIGALSLIVVTMVTIGMLEYFSRRCEFDRSAYGVRCLDLIKKYVEDENGTKHYLASVFPSYFIKQTYDFETIVDEYAYYIDQADMPGLNGIACSPYIFISRELHPRAKRFVAYHEAFHVIGETSETRANFRAALKEPVGFVQTVFHSISGGSNDKALKEYPCMLGGLWRTFKVYFLGGSF